MVKFGSELRYGVRSPNVRTPVDIPTVNITDMLVLKRFAIILIIQKNRLLDIVFRNMHLVFNVSLSYQLTYGTDFCEVCQEKIMPGHTCIPPTSS